MSRMDGAMRTLVAWVAALGLACAFAAEPPRTLRFETFGREQGLEQESILSQLQDRQGFMWFGTQGGVVRHDGYRATVYRADAADPDALVDNWVAALLEDRQGRLWVGTRGGLQRFDATRAAFVGVRLAGAGAMPSVRALLGAPPGVDRDDLWIGTTSGLFRLQPRSGRIDAWHHDPARADTLPSDVVTSLAWDASGRLWVGTSAGLARLSADAARLQRFRVDSADEPNARRNAIGALRTDAAGALWIGTGTGLEVWRPGADAPLRRRFGAAEGLPEDEVQALLADASGALWVGTRNNGLLRWDPAAGRFLVYRQHVADPHSLADDNVMSLYQDRSGTLWAGTRTGGASRVDLGSGGFERHALFDPGSVTRAASKIYAIAEGEGGVLWLGSMGGGLHRFDRRSGETRTFRHDPADPSSLPDDTVTAVHIDGQGRYWIGTFQGVSRFDPATGKFTPQWRDTSEPAIERVRGIASDVAGVLWLGTEGGLVRHDPATGATRVFHHVADDPRSVGQGWVIALHVDRRGQLWIGTDATLDRLLPDGEHVEHIAGDARNAVPRIARVSHIGEDRSGRLWVGTSEGLLRIDEPAAAAPRIQRYDRADGLASAVVGATLQDADGKLWISTIAGLSRLDPYTGAVRNFTNRDGLIDGSYYVGSAWAMVDGTLLFGGPNGLTEFRPEAVRDNAIAPEVAITDVQLGNHALDPEALPAGVELARPVNAARSLRLAYAHSVLTLEFAALHYADPARNRYAYRLRGFDPRWTEADATRRYATYTNLDPGEYVFEVKAANKDGVWSLQPARLAITVLPPWWATWWVRLAAAAAFALALWALYRYRVRGLHRQRARLQAEVQRAVAETVRQRDEVEQGRQDLGVLGEIGREITAKLDVAEVCRTLDRHVHELLDASTFAIYLLDADGRTLTSALRVEDGQALPTATIELDNPTRHAAKCARERAELVYDLAPDDPNPSYVPGTVYTLSALFAPLLAGDRLLGVMTIQTPRRHAYGARERDVFRTLCAYGAIALDNASAYLRVRATDEQLQRLAREQQVILDNAAAAVFMVRDRVIERCNRGMEEMLGYAPGELIGKSTEIYHADHASWMAQGRRVYGAIEAGEVAEGELEIVRKDGQRIWIMYRGRAVDPRDPTQGSIWVSQDITERKRTEAELERIRREQQIVFDNSPGGGVLLTRNRVIVSAAAGLEQALGHAPGSLVGQSTRGFFESDQAFEEFGAWAYPVLATGQTAKGEREFLRSDGEPVPFYISGKALDPDDVSQGVVWLMQDIRQQQKDAAELDRARRELQIIFDNNIGAIAVVRDGRIERCSRGFLAMYGYEPGEVVGMSVDAFSASVDESQALGRTTTPELQAGHVVSGEFRYRRKDGSFGWLVYQGRALAPPDLDQGTIWLCQDISALKAQETALRDSKTHVEESLHEVEHLNRQVTLLGELTGFLQACPSAQEAFACIGEFGPRLFPDSAGALFLADDDGRAWLEHGGWGGMGQAGESFGAGDCWALRRSRAYRVDAPAEALCCPHVRAHAVHDRAYACLPLTAQGKTFGLLHLNHAPSTLSADAAERRHGMAVAMADQIALAIANVQLREQLLQQSIRDPLTGLFNRRHLQEALFRELARCKRERAPAALLMVDVDHFKRCNDRYGHPAGDAVLQAVAKVLEAHVRQGELACRFGGEEFAVLLPGCDLDGGLRVGARILEGVRALVPVHENRPLDRVTVSLGLAVFPQDGSTPQSLVEAADAALYAAKEEGRDRLAVASRG
jgi:diguanylate cyclase (GGDEF)-like protein/PAS domain S-box-containing protein